jgi:fimbrial chaperone protein
MEELPSLESVTQAAGSVLTLRMKIGVPVFLGPAGAPVVSGTVQNAAIHGATLDFDVANTGNTHFSVQTVHLVGKNATGGDVFAQDLTGWYVLAGKSRHYSIPITKARCAALRSLAVNVKADTVTFSHEFAGLSSECSST